eukprot:403374154
MNLGGGKSNLGAFSQPQKQYNDLSYQKPQLNYPLQTQAGLSSLQAPKLQSFAMGSPILGQEPSSFNRAKFDLNQPRSNMATIPEQTSLNIGLQSSDRMNKNMNNNNYLNSPKSNNSYQSQTLGNRLQSQSQLQNNAYQENMRSRQQLFGDYDPFKDNQQQNGLGNKSLSNKQLQSQYHTRGDSRTKDMRDIRQKSMIGEIGKTLIHPQQSDSMQDRKMREADSRRQGMAFTVNNSIGNYQGVREQLQQQRDRDNQSTGGNSPKNSYAQNNSDMQSLLNRAAGLTVNETERLRDAKHNFAADHLRKQHVIENERGGLFDRPENSGVKSLYIPASNNVNDEIQAQFYKNKQKHQSHVNQFLDEPTQNLNSQDVQAQLNPNNMTTEDKRNFINNKLQYVQLNIPGSAPNINIGNFELALKRPTISIEEIDSATLSQEKSLLNTPDQNQNDDLTPVIDYSGQFSSKKDDIQNMQQQESQDPLNDDEYDVFFADSSKRTPHETLVKSISPLTQREESLGQAQLGIQVLDIKKELSQDSQGSKDGANGNEYNENLLNQTVIMEEQSQLNGSQTKPAGFIQNLKSYFKGSGDQKQTVNLKSSAGPPQPQQNNQNIHLLGSSPQSQRERKGSHCIIEQIKKKESQEVELISGQNGNNLTAVNGNYLGTPRTSSIKIKLNKSRSEAKLNKNKHSGDQGCNSQSSGDEETKIMRENSSFVKTFEKIENTKEQYLILLVHGIGTREEYQKQNVSEFKKSMEKVCKLYFKNSNYEFVIKMVDWKSILNNQQTKEKIDRVTVVDGAQSVREVFNETVVDILFYLSKQYRHQILLKVASEAKKYYNELYQNGNNKRFKGKVTWIGHSLGTAISYDLLSRQWSKKPQYQRASTAGKHIFEEMHILEQQQQFDQVFQQQEIPRLSDEDVALQLGFNIQQYFLLGSPLGLFISIYNEENFIKEKLPTCKHFFNIFHPSDFIAYRIEPLFLSNDAGGIKHEILPPVKLPYYKNNGYRTYLSIANFFKQNPNNNIMHSAFQQINEVHNQLKAQEAEQLLKETSNSLLCRDSEAGDKLAQRNYGSMSNGSGSRRKEKKKELKESKFKCSCKIVQDKATKISITTCNAKNPQCQQADDSFDEDYCENNNNSDSENSEEDENERYDFVLQEKGLETIIKPVGILKAHIKYFSSKDVAYFILKKIHKHKDIPYYL